MAQQDREGVLSEEAALTTIRTVAKTVKLKQKYLFQRRNYRTSRVSLKAHLSQKNITDRAPTSSRGFSIFKGKALGTRLTVPEGYTQGLFG